MLLLSVMVLTTRELSPVVVQASTYQQTAPSQLLDTLEGDKLVGLLRQIAQLSEHAAEIFTGPQHPQQQPTHTADYRHSSPGVR